MNDRMSNNDADRREGIRRTALILTALAAAFYVGFILMGVLNA
jgi:hypothetical protein